MSISVSPTNQTAATTSTQPTKNQTTMMQRVAAKVSEVAKKAGEKIYEHRADVATVLIFSAVLYATGSVPIAGQATTLALAALSLSGEDVSIGNKVNAFIGSKVTMAKAA